MTIPQSTQILIICFSFSYGAPQHHHHAVWGSSNSSTEHSGAWVSRSFAKRANSSSPYGTSNWKPIWNEEPNYWNSFLMKKFCRWPCTKKVVINEINFMINYWYIISLNRGSNEALVGYKGWNRLDNWQCQREKL